MAHDSRTITTEAASCFECTKVLLDTFVAAISSYPGHDEPVRVYREGEWWFESPGAHHGVSANASKTRPARLLAVFIVDAAEVELTSPDPHVAPAGMKTLGV
jgi:hypothetical protein